MNAYAFLRRNRKIVNLGLAIIFFLSSAIGLVQKSQAAGGCIEGYLTSTRYRYANCAEVVWDGYNWVWATSGGTGGGTTGAGSSQQTQSGCAEIYTKGVIELLPEVARRKGVPLEALKAVNGGNVAYFTRKLCIPPAPAWVTHQGYIPAIVSCSVSGNTANVFKDGQQVTSVAIGEEQWTASQPYWRSGWLKFVDGDGLTEYQIQIHVWYVKAVFGIGWWWLPSSCQQTGRESHTDNLYYLVRRW